MIYFTVYKTTNIINGKFYIGVHKTTNPNDSYLGSGKRLKLAIEKYGETNFKKEILSIFDSYKLAYEEEQKLVTNEMISLGNCYNLAPGGIGGCSKMPVSDLTKSKLSNALIGRPKSEEHKTNISKGKKNKPNTHFIGKHLSDETKAKIRESKKNLVVSDEWKENISKAQLGNKNRIGKFHSEETKEKLRLKGKSRVVSPETKLKISNSMKISRAKTAASSVSSLFDI